MHYNSQLLPEGLKFAHLCLGGQGQSFPRQLDAKAVKTTTKKISSPAQIFRHPDVSAVQGLSCLSSPRFLY